MCDTIQKSGGDAAAVAPASSTANSSPQGQQHKHYSNCSHSQNGRQGYQGYYNHQQAYPNYSVPNSLHDQLYGPGYHQQWQGEFYNL